MEVNKLTYLVRGCLFRVHSALGPGLLESIYEEALSLELSQANILFETQVSYPVFYNQNKLKKEFKLDLLIDGCLILELKSVENILPVHAKQLQTYLKITNLKIGLLVNFNVSNLQDGIHRIVNKL